MRRKELAKNKKKVVEEELKEADELLRDRDSEGSPEKEAGEEAGKEEPENIDTGAEEGKPEEPQSKGEEKEPEEEKDKRDEKIAELNDKNLRLMAEFENFRKRTDREKEQMFENGAKSVIEKVLPVIDNFERALDMTSSEGSEEKENDPFMDGMQKVYRQLMDELEKIGVKPIEAVGTEFNPEFHNAVMQVDSEEFDSGIVAMEMQKGYMFNDSVVRHSMVGVAK
ncbi:MAG: nucleotide exchange factor GrpE [Lachnospiraceae bacterium]|nr:nucleotide exchange factor GrpE [Lachnospiraceae bacterium]